jgi:hypothetical protein
MEKQDHKSHQKSVSGAKVKKKEKKEKKGNKHENSYNAKACQLWLAQNDVSNMVVVCHLRQRPA